MAKQQQCPKCQKLYEPGQTRCPADQATLLEVSDAAQLAAAAQEALLGQLLEGRYQVQSILGSGGMGTVYLAEHTITHAIYAVKVMHSALVDNEAARKRFDSEARTLSGMDHPHVVETYDHGRTPAGVPFLVMEYLRGITLRQCLQELPGSGLPLIQAVSITRQVADALHHVHERGIIHRDIKPDNIQLTVHNASSVFAKLFDFGIARLQSQSRVTELKAAPPSTLAYAPPELHTSASYLSPALDVYALGITLFEMVTKERPFAGTGLDVVWAHMKDKPRALSQARRDIKIPAELEQLTAHMLEKQPAQRPTMVQVKERLAALASVLQAEAGRDLHSLRTYVLPEKRRPTDVSREMPVIPAGQPPPPTALQVLSFERDLDVLETEREKTCTRLQKECEAIIAGPWAEAAPPELTQRLRRCSEIAAAKTELTGNLSRLQDALTQEKAESRAKRNALRQQLQALRDELRGHPTAQGPAWQEKAEALARVERAYAAPEPVSKIAEQVQREGTRQQMLRAELLETQRTLAEDLLHAIRESAKRPPSPQVARLLPKLGMSVKRLMELLGHLDGLNATLKQS